MSRAVNVVNKIKELEQTFDRPLVIVETGTIRNTKPEYKEGDGWSTFYIAQYLKENNREHKFYSIDLDVSVARKFLEEHNLIDYVTLLAEHSLTVLDTFSVADIVYLDSANDADLILSEFKIIEAVLSKEGVVIVDDVIIDSKLVFKGHKVVPYAREKGYNVKLLDRQAVIKNA